MSLQDLIEQYVAKVKEKNEIAQVKKLVEERLGKAATEAGNFKWEIANFLKKAGATEIHTFLLEIEGKQTVCQIDLGYHPEREEFLLFTEVSSFKDFTSTPEVSTDDMGNHVNSIALEVYDSIHSER